MSASESAKRRRLNEIDDDGESMGRKRQQPASGRVRLGSPTGVSQTGNTSTALPSGSKSSISGLPFPETPSSRKAGSSTSNDGELL